MKVYNIGQTRLIVSNPIEDIQDYGWCFFIPEYSKNTIEKTAKASVRYLKLFRWLGLNFQWDLNK